MRLWQVMLTSILLTLPSSANADLNAGLLAYWSFDDGTAVDNSGNGFDGVISGPITADFGVIGSALRFNGPGSVVEVAGDPLGMATDRVRTLTMWVHPTAITAPVVDGDTTGMLIHKYRPFNVTTSNYYAAISQRASGSLETRLTGQGTDVLDVIGGVAVGEWQHFVFVLKPGPGESRISRNGQLIGAGTLTFSSQVTPEPLLIGNSRGAGDQAFEGLLDEIRIYDRVISDMEITALAGRCWCPPPVHCTSGHTLNGASVSSRLEPKW